MQFHISLLFLTTLLATTPTIVHAADCKNWDPAMGIFLKTSQDQIWAVRQRMCGSGVCGDGWQCTLEDRSEYGDVTIYRKNDNKNFDNCWDATANIITQCNRGWRKTGWWQLGDEFYQIWVSPALGLKKERGFEVNGESEKKREEAKRDE